MYPPKKILLLFIAVYSINFYSQTATLLLSKGGDSSGGTILQVDTNNGNYEVVPINGKIGNKEFKISVNSTINSAQSGVFYESSNNSLYITTLFGYREIDKVQVTGEIYRYDLDDGKTYPVHNFIQNSKLGTYPLGKLEKVGNLLYGVAKEGGDFGFGCIYSIDPTNNDAYSVIHSFNGTTEGGNPSCQLFAVGNVLYGGGVRGNGNNDEVYFSYDTNTSTHTTLFIDEQTISGDLRSVFIRNNKMYISVGNEINQIDLSNTAAGRLNYYSGLTPNTQLGNKAWENTFRTGDNSWYTVFQLGGVNGFGSIAKYNFGSQSMVNVHNFQGGALGKNPSVQMLNGLNGDIYGLASASNETDAYVLFKFSSVGIYSILHTFTNVSEGLNIAASMQLVGAKIYGIALDGGINKGGTVWSYDLSNDNFLVEAQLGYSDGKSPIAGISLNPNSSTYDFVCWQGGEKYGTLNTFNPTTKSYSNVTKFNEIKFQGVLHTPIHANNKTYLLVKLEQAQIVSNNSIYALAEINLSNGTKNGNFLPIAPSANSSDLPKTIVYANIIQDGNTLYGASRGYIWSIDLVNQTYTTLYTFNSTTDGSEPSSIILSNNVLYGVNDIGGTNNEGSIFSFDLSNNSYTNLESAAQNKEFVGIAKSGNKLYTVLKDDNSGDSVQELDLTVGSPSFSSVANIDASTIGSNPGPHLG